MARSHGACGVIHPVIFTERLTMCLGGMRADIWKTVGREKKKTIDKIEEKPHGEVTFILPLPLVCPRIKMGLHAS